MKSAQVTRTLRASAASRMSVQCSVNPDLSPNRKATGKVVGNPIEVSPFAVYGRKSVKLNASETLPQPPFWLVIIPLNKSIGQASKNRHTTEGITLELLLDK